MNERCIIINSKKDEEIGFFGSLVSLLRVGAVDMRIDDGRAVAYELHNNAGCDGAGGAYRHHLHHQAPSNVGTRSTSSAKFMTHSIAPCTTPSPCLTRW